MTNLVTVGLLLFFMAAALYYFTIPSLDDPTRIRMILGDTTAIVMLILFFCYLLFRTRTHVYLFTDDNSENIDEEPGEPIANGDYSEDEGEEPERHVETAVLHPRFAAILLPVALALIVFCSRNLARSLSTSAAPGSFKPFIGVILLPLLNHPRDSFLATKLAYEGQVQLAISLAAESNVSIVLFVIPLLTILCWIKGEFTILAFDGFEIIAIVVAAVVEKSYVIPSGKSNYLLGTLLLGL